jgi:hypothetical protein
MKRYYISVPITGISDFESKGWCQMAVDRIKKMGVDSINIVTPFQIAENWTNKIFTKPKYADYIGFDISYIIDSIDVIYFCRGWEKSKGCMLEFSAAKIYGKEMIFE